MGMKPKRPAKLVRRAHLHADGEWQAWSELYCGDTLLYLSWRRLGWEPPTDRYIRVPWLDSPK